MQKPVLSMPLLGIFSWHLPSNSMGPVYTTSD